jgi:hypothetical protein
MWWHFGQEMVFPRHYRRMDGGTPPLRREPVPCIVEAGAGALSKRRNTLLKEM